MTTTTADVRDLYDQCGGDLEKVAARLGIPYSDFVQRHGVDLAPPSISPARRRPPPADLGASKSIDRQYIVAVRHSDNPNWPRESQTAIDEARAKYEAGTHELIQGRDRDWFIQYCIPRKAKTAARKFFQPN